MITLEQMKSEDFDFYKLNKSDREKAINLVKFVCPKEEIDILEKALEVGWRPQKYLGDNKWGCSFGK